MNDWYNQQHFALVQFGLFNLIFKNYVQKQQLVLFYKKAALKSSAVFTGKHLGFSF